MWLFAMFDLPVDTKAARRQYVKFRNYLLSEGFSMLQYSVYARCAVTLDKKDSLMRKLKELNPGTGNVQIMFITDAQWKKSVILHAIRDMSKRGINNKSQVEEQLQFW